MIEEIASEFRDAAVLGIRHPAAAPLAPARRTTPDDASASDVAAAGRRALGLYAHRARVRTAAEVRAGLYVLALVPVAGLATYGDGVQADTLPTISSPTTGRDATATAVGAFAVTVLGVDPGLRLDAYPELLDVLPAAWGNALYLLLRVLQPHTRRGARARPQAATAVARLALLALSRGVVAPDAGVPWEAVERWARAVGWTMRVVRDWRRALLGAEAVLASARPGGGASATPGDTDDALGALHAWLQVIRNAHEAAGPRGLRGTLERLGREVPPRVLRGPGATPDPDAARLGLDAAGQDQLALLRAVAPDFVDLVLAPRGGTAKRGHATALREGTAANVLGLVDRLLAQVARRWPDRPLATLSPADLLTERVPASWLRVRLPAEEGQSWVERALKRPVDGPTVPLLLYLFDQQLDSSRAHSPQVRRAAPDAPIGFTQSLVKEARAFCHAFRRAAVWRTGYQTEARAALEQLAGVADEVAATMERTLGPQPDRPKVKDVRRLIALVSWPQLLCVGLPRLRAHVYALRRAMERRPRFGELPVDPATYEEYLELYVVLAVFAADPLRIKNWRYGRLGREIMLTLDPRAPTPQILGVHTHFTGDGDDDYRHAALKIARDGSGLRDRELDWAVGAVDLRLVLEYLVRVRAQRAAAHTGLYYRELAAELRGELPRLPLFLSAPRANARALPPAAPLASELAAAEFAAAVAMGEDALRRKFAQALHWVARQALGRDLPPWEEFEPVRGDLFYGVFTPHVVRALMATYLLKVRARGTIGDALGEEARLALAQHRARRRTPARYGESTRAVATRLLGDREKTLHRSYVAWSKDLAARLREPVDDWTHPAAHDRFVDRLLCVPGPIEFADEPDLLLPPNCTHDDLRVW